MGGTLSAAFYCVSVRLARECNCADCPLRESFGFARFAPLRIRSLGCALVGFVGEIGKRRGASRGATQELRTIKGVRRQTYAVNCAGCLSGL